MHSYQIEDPTMHLLLEVSSRVVSVYILDYQYKMTSQYRCHSQLKTSRAAPGAIAESVVNILLSSNVSRAANWPN